MRKVFEKILCTNAASATSTGTATARARVASPRLRFGLFVVFQANSGAPTSYTGNTLNCYGYVKDSRGVSYLATVEPFNNDGVGAQALPGGIEGETMFDEIELSHAYQGVSVAGRWLAVLIVEPAPGVNMCPEEFATLSGECGLNITSLGAAT